MRGLKGEGLNCILRAIRSQAICNCAGVSGKTNGGEDVVAAHGVFFFI